MTRIIWRVSVVLLHLLFALVAAQEPRAYVPPTSRSGSYSDVGEYAADARLDAFVKERTEQFQAEKAGTLAMEAELLGSSGTTRSSPGPLRVHLDYDQMTDHGSAVLSEIQARIRDEVMPLAVADLGLRLTVRAPPEGALKLPVSCRSWWDLGGGEIACLKNRGDATNPGWCYEGDNVRHSFKYYGPSELCTSPNKATDCTQHPGGEGAANADVILYVIADDAYCGGELAHAAACEFDSSTNRPVAGLVNFCPSQVASSNQAPIDMAKTAVHEILHVLFFSNWLMVNQYIGEDGNGYSTAELFATDALGRTLLKTPWVQTKAREHFDCPTLQGAPLENGGGAGSSSSHWESEHIRGDTMGPRSSWSGKVDLGPLTMALAEDSGWYFGNWDAVGHTPFGYHAGCSFLSNSCTDYAAESSTQRFFCPAGFDGYRCSADARYAASCQSDSVFHPGCRGLYEPFRYYNLESQIVTANCYDPEQQAINSDGFLGNSFGQHSRCVESRGEITAPDGYVTSWPHCLQMSCTLSGMLQLHLGSAKVDCPTGQDVSVSNVDGFSGTFGPCPDNVGVCASLSCPEDCNSNGRCLGGVCYCYPGFVGVDCSAPVCTPQTCEGECILGFGICDDIAGAGDLVSLATGKPSQQSSTAYGGVSSRAVDGNTSGAWADGSCIHTSRGADTMPWWAVDLGATHEIRQVRVVNRQDCCSGRLSDLHIVVSDEMPSPALGEAIDGIGVTVCTQRQGTLSAAEYTLDCDRPVRGRFLSIQKMQGILLALCEVEVWGFPVALSASNNGEIGMLTCQHGDSTLQVGWTSVGELARCVNKATGGVTGEALHCDGGIIRVERVVSPGAVRATCLHAQDS